MVRHDVVPLRGFGNRIKGKLGAGLDDVAFDASLACVRRATSSMSPNCKIGNSRVIIAEAYRMGGLRNWWLP